MVVDPFLFEACGAYPLEHRPLQLRELGPIDAVLITHSHPGHSDPRSLPGSPPETRMIVRGVDRETILSVAMELRLRELGFVKVQALDSGVTTMAGDISVHPLPFYGEQRADCDVLHPAIRNAGNTHLVRTPAFAVVFLANSNRDGRGDVREPALRTRALLGTVDAVFPSYRGWLTYPGQYLFSSAARFLLFVPPSLWSVRQQIMTTADEAVDVAERWARFLVPYADGGAPWLWKMGPGPDLSAESFGRDGRLRPGPGAGARRTGGAIAELSWPAARLMRAAAAAAPRRFAAFPLLGAVAATAARVRPTVRRPDGARRGIAPASPSIPASARYAKLPASIIAGRRDEGARYTCTKPDRLRRCDGRTES